eukprot:CAMPEP_0171144082 /NCGR_PEP_ID=MMETSP0766_2-20121228/145336_1 /TAXON_ID=439317 /ORGANISM="Gambierdiscus australes, Strain CAWD 149" /LENGTH=85 /DNA_ID=CAMNT_0011607927 /DNA_START=24 /DNA_END=278 /DNA_ORIENTATION=-
MTSPSRPESARRSKPRLQLISFGHRFGPGEGIVYDVRHLDNPAGKHLAAQGYSGLHARLRKEVLQCEGAPELLQQMASDIARQLS